MISNTSPIIFLAKIKSPDLFKKLYGKIKITSAVKKELLIENKPEVEIIKNAINEGTLVIKDPNKSLVLNLGKGEASAINLAMETKDSLIIDDATVIKAAKLLNIEVLRTTAVIFSAVKKSLLTKKEALEKINKIIG